MKSKREEEKKVSDGMVGALEGGEEGGREKERGRTAGEEMEKDIFRGKIK